jgi:hypothetical protein
MLCHDKVLRLHGPQQLVIRPSHADTLEESGQLQPLVAASSCRQADPSSAQRCTGWSTN